MNCKGLGLVLTSSVVFAVLGCNGGSGGGTKSTSPGSTNNPPAPTNSANAPTIMRATVANVASRASVAAGDTLTVTFSKEVKLSASATNPSMEFVLPVKGDSFGTGATMAAGTAATDVVITLGAGVNLRVSGTFNIAAVGSGDASGIDVPATPTGNITNATTGDKTASAPCDVSGPFTEAWTPAAAMQTPRGGHTATLLNDGRILIVGGFQILPAAGGQPAGPGFCLESEIFDPIANTFTKTSDPSLGGPNNGDMFVQVTFGGQTGVLPVARTDHTATLLADGTVLICGGYGFESLDPAQTAQPTPLQGDLKTAHIFDPKTNTFALVQGTLNIPRLMHYAVLLPNGTVLVTGGLNDNIGTPPQSLTLPAAEIYDPAKQTFTPLSTTGNDMVVPRMAGVAAFDKGSNGAIFVGGEASFLPQGATTPQIGLCPGAEIFSPTAGTFAATTSAPPSDLRFQAFAIDGAGELVLAGGSGMTPAVMDVVIESSGSFAPIGSLTVARARAQAATVGGNIVVVAGGSTMSGQAKSELASVEIVNTDSKKIEAAPPMQNARNSHTLTAVKGKVYAIGGFNNGAGQYVNSMDGQSVPMAEVYSRP